jgi:O-methyltransferase
MATSVRELLKRSPIAVRAYRACRRWVSRIPRPGQPRVEYPQHLPDNIEQHAARRALFDSLWKNYHAAHGRPADSTRIMHFMYLVEAANALAPGDYIELGTHKGFTLRLIHKLMDPTRTLYSLDTFEGFDARDIKVENTVYENNWTVGNFLPTSDQAVSVYVGDGVAPANLKVIKGWFPESFAGLENHSWRFIHIDFDLYQPIKVAMEMLWGKLVPGGVMLVHDYGCLGFPGARKAVEEFCDARGIYPVQLGDRWGSAVLRKSR